VLGTQGASKLVENWSCSEDSPLFPLRNHISLVRFQQISRYLKINAPGEANNSLSDEEFWHKVDPLVSSFRQRCRANLQPGSIFAIDEQLRCNKGRWKHALQISSKADSKGVKIYSLCIGYYCFDFIFASKVVTVPEAGKFIPTDPTAKPFSLSERVILTLIERLEAEHPNEVFHLTLACDNFFTTHKLFKELRERGISAYGTAKDGSGMPKQHIQLRDCTDKKTDYGLVCNSVFGGVNHVTFIDQKAVHMMTTAHDVVNEDPHWRDAKTRRDACRTRARETAGRTELPYPQLSHDYNNNMNSCDLASQVWSYFTVSRYSHWRNWWPMLWIILDASIANVLYLYRLQGFTESQLSHRDLQTRIGFQLLRDPASVLRERESTANAVGLQPSKLRRSQHEWIKGGKTPQGHDRRGECEQCKRTAPVGRPRKEMPRIPLQEISINTRRRGPWTRFKCKECNVWLCHNSVCWQRHHLEPQDWYDARV
jgi:Transposase IS4